MDYFSIAAAQTEVHQCRNKQEILKNNLPRHMEIIDRIVPYISRITGAPCRLVAFPEFGLHGRPHQEYLNTGSWDGLLIDIPGEETELLARKAREHNIFIVSHGWTMYPDLPGRPFSVAFLVAPSGEVILKYHKVVPAKSIELSAAPSDVYDWFVAKFGDSLDAFFPVADTEIGKIGLFICNDGAFPEVPRGLAMNGAEILVRPNAWVQPLMAEPQDIIGIHNRFHAFTNMCYLLQPNWGYYYGGLFLKDPGAGRSMIVDYRGRLLAQTEGGAETMIGAEVNMDSLRRFRQECDYIAPLTLMQNSAFRKIYETEMWPKNRILNQKEAWSTPQIRAVREEVVKRRSDIFTPPKGQAR